MSWVLDLSLSFCWINGMLVPTLDSREKPNSQRNSGQIIYHHRTPSLTPAMTSHESQGIAIHWQLLFRPQHLQSEHAGAFPFPIKKLITSVTAHEPTASDKWLSPCYGENSPAHSYSVVFADFWTRKGLAMECQVCWYLSVTLALEGHEDIAQLMDNGVRDPL